MQIVTCGVVIIAASILFFRLGGPVFILATLLSLTAKLDWNNRGWHQLELGAVSWEGMYHLWEELSEAQLELHGLSLCQVLLQSVPAAFQQVVSYRLVTGHTFINQSHLGLLHDCFGGAASFLASVWLASSFSAASFSLMKMFPFLIVPRFLLGWLDSLGQSLQLCQGLFTGTFIPRGLVFSSLPSFCLIVSCLSTSWKWSLSALTSAGTSMLLTQSIFLVFFCFRWCHLVLCSSPGQEHLILLSCHKEEGSIQVIWGHILGAGDPSHGQVEI